MDDLIKEQLAIAEKELRDVLKGLNVGQDAATIDADAGKTTGGIVCFGAVTIEQLTQYVIFDLQDP